MRRTMIVFIALVETSQQQTSDTTIAGIAGETSISLMVFLAFQRG